MEHPIHRITSVDHLGDFRLRVSFDDGITRDLDLEAVLEGELYGPLRDPSVFAKVTVDPEVHTIVWPNGADFDPAILHDWPKKQAAFQRLAAGWSPGERPRQRESRAPLRRSAVMIELPQWTHAQGGTSKWQDWIRAKTKSCMTRAVKWSAKQAKPVALPTRAEWMNAIIAAVENSGGRGCYSRLPLSLAPPRKPTDWNWPSVDHSKDPGTAELVLETRLVNDMKTIMTPGEFQEVVGHLAAVLKIAVKTLPASWKCDRSFAGLQEPDEPALPGPADPN